MKLSLHTAQASLRPISSEPTRCSIESDASSGRIVILSCNLAMFATVSAIYCSGAASGFLDPDFAFTKAYGLCWEARNETAYPSTFIIGKENRVRFAHVSSQHGDRVDSTAAIKALAE